MLMEVGKAMFIIEVTEVVEQAVIRSEWMPIADTGNPKDNGPIYDYVASTRREDRKTIRYRQEQEALDLIAVIKAVNGLGAA